MKRLRPTILFFIIMAIVFASFILISCREKSKEGCIILTRTAGRIENPNLFAAESQKFNFPAEIVAIEPGKSEVIPKVLTSSFYSARSPEISNDGQFMIFAAQKKEGDPWQIWEMDLNDLKSRQSIFKGKTALQSAYLPLRWSLSYLIILLPIREIK